ncbi:anaerobic carbon-monoxide dehydrogenase catalytic subunit [Desulfotomaculum copahuensis]|uniref:anaerobic carbon-monoxide dehydrogenase n=1 Tax=Desulfotomaculum copahuensis TaxID=1838280 RepID=A0A1B7LKJ6_9FIRM|nr:anaerobic carbon-monoxide dehydrogenase catalytic subunit [Desulfotomaculum copahuensis]OAT87095.1 carbon-monoxide dehydrogenase catalytic subunit [Desulfotomaculum copahuensis]
MKKVCPSADEILSRFIVSKDDVETAFHRLSTQQPKCGFGLQGVCCRLCSNGPCRVTPKSPRGVCGADADTMVARNFLRAVAAGAACYLHVVENAAGSLQAAAASGKEIQGAAVLAELAGALDLPGSDARERAGHLAGQVMDDLYRPRQKQMALTEKLAYAPRLARWRELGIIPGGAKSEVFDALVKTSTNQSSDPVDMMLHALRLGIATGIYGLELTNLLNDVLLGEPKIAAGPVGFSVVDPDYINIMVTGHQHALIGPVQEGLAAPRAIDLARQAGARGFKIIGCTCVGQDLQSRGDQNGVFAGHAGNNFTSEALLATGGVDLVLSEFNCTLPGIEEVCRQYMVAQICLDDVAKKQNAGYLPFDPGAGEETARRVVEAAVESYRQRRGRIGINVPEHGYENSLAGLSERNLRAFLGGNYKPLIELIASGRVKGLAAIVGCSNLTAGGHDVFTAGLTRELIARDILVLSAGCTSGGLENLGFMSPEAAGWAGEKLRQVCRELNIPPVLNFGPCLGIGRLEMVAAGIAAALQVDLPQLPLVLSAPQWLEEQALADGAFGLALGLPLHLALPPFITGSKLVTRVLTEDMEKLTGGRVIVEGEIVPAAEQLEAVIMQRRAALGI